MPTLPAMAYVTAFHEPTLESPPELSLSKSSKCSSEDSFRFSCLSDALSMENLSHFEDISLDEHVESNGFTPPHLKRAVTLPPPRPVIRSKPKTKRSMHTVDSMHSVHIARSDSGISPSLPTLRSQNNERISRPSLRTTRLSCATNTFDSRNVRSVSPQKSFASSLGGESPKSFSGSSGFLGTTSQFCRRQSWQPGRKSIRELEAEYHNSDEEVPEDAVMYNVPVSPLPLPTQHRQSTSREESSGPSEGCVDSHAPSPTSTKRMAQLQRSATIDELPLREYAPPSLLERTRSWADCLSEDTRKLSATLEEYTSNHEATQVPVLATTLRKVDLPPLQRNNIMIDPLPMSKEKEAVLARTRPSWLPPKCQREEKRHLRQWEKMMVRSAQAEKRRGDKQMSRDERLKDEKKQVAQAWEDHVLPNWASVVDLPQTRELWWRGIPSRDRGAVWCKAIGNELEITPKTFETALRRAKEVEGDVAKSPTDEGEERSSHQFTAIGRDIDTIALGCPHFAGESGYRLALKQVLMAYTLYRSDVGYVHGLHDTAALLVLHMSACDAFIALANLYNRSLPLAYLIQDRATIDRWQSLMLKTMRYKLPTLLDHLLSSRAGFSCPEEWLEPMMFTLFTRHPEISTAARVMDIYAFEGDKFLIRAMVGLLAILESRLYGSRHEILKVLGWEASSDAWTSASTGTEDDVVKSIRVAGKMGDAH